MSENITFITKCEPLACKWFLRVFEQRYTKDRMDEWIMKCPSWLYPNKCLSKKRKETGID